MTSAPPRVDVAAAHRRAVEHLVALQRPDGCWEGEMVWNTMILAQRVIVGHVLAASSPDEATGAAMVRHFATTVTPEGGWGLHPESGPCVYVTTLAYVALRLLGVGPGEPLTARARRWLRGRPGGVLAIPTWGKFWLALLGLYDYAGVNPFPPELFLLPRWSLHPDRLYCHTRTIYQAIAYLYGRRFRAELGTLGGLLRDELYGGPVAPDTYAAHREVLAGTDVHVRPSALLRAGYRALLALERHPPRGLRRRALARCLARIRDEQRVTREQGLSPVSGLLNCLALFAHDPSDPQVGAALAGTEYWRWSDPEGGVRYAGARSHSWDTAFALEALAAGPEDDAENGAPCARRRGCAFLRGAQLRDELPAPIPAGRAPVRGGWCFSDGGHRWPVSDCTAEAIAALLRADPAGLPAERLTAGVGFLLHRQNRDGGFGTYEPRRAPRLLETLNPSEMFADCMVEGSYVECTGSALVALARARPRLPAALARRAERATRSAVAFLRRSQCRDGGFLGSWGINVTYATFLALRGLRAAGVPADDPVCARAVARLAAVARADGGWGEHHSGCLEHRYVEHPRSQPVMTAWAVLGLLAGGAAPDDPAVCRGVQWLCRAQRGDGSWPPGAVNGVFFGTAMLDYRLYPVTFPTWALGAYLAASGER